MSDSNFTYLNRESRWADFRRYGLAMSPEGDVRLRPIPMVNVELPSDLAMLPSPDGPAGVTIAPDGTLLYTFPTKSELWRSHPCGNGPSLIPCINREGQEATSQLGTPRGLLVHPIRQALIVVDCGNDRLMWFDLQTFQLIDEWGSTGTQPGFFSEPWTVDADRAGNVYVTDVGNRRVQKFNLHGGVIPEFWTNVVNSVPFQWSLQKTVDVAVLPTESGAKILFLDADRSAVVVVNDAGIFQEAFYLTEIPFGQAAGMTVSADALYVSANEPGGGKVYQYQLDGTLDGTVHGYRGPVAALRLSRHHTLFIHPGVKYAPFACPLSGAFRESGFMWGGPFSTTSVMDRQWHLLSSEFERASDAGHLQLYVYSAGSTQPPVEWNALAVSEPPWMKGYEEFDQVRETVVEADSKRFAPSGTKPQRHRDRWIRLVPDTAHTLLPGEAGDDLWIGIEFVGDGSASAVLSQIRIDWDHETYLQYLPEIYRKDLRSSQFLGGFLSTYESLYRDVEDRISHLRELFDPFAVSADLLPWLAGWLALDMNPEWSEHEQRQAIAQAFAGYALRGTPRGLRQAIRQYTGVEATIEEPLLNAAWWALPAPETGQTYETAMSILGVTSMLIPAEAQGAVVGTTAVLDHSHLIDQEDFGVPLFSDVAYQFMVQVHHGQVQDERKREEVQAVIEREKPAHTAFHLCIVRPTMRIGFQARLGIDTVVAGPTLSTRLGGTSVVQEKFVLGGTLPGKMGVHNRIGVTTYLTDGTTDQGH